MITNNTGYTIQRLRGMASDTKPLNMPNGSEYLEMDTGDKYLYDAAGSTWIKQGSGGGGGGDSSVVMFTVQYDAAGNNYKIPATVQELIATMESGKMLLLNFPQTSNTGEKMLEPVTSIQVTDAEEYSALIMSQSKHFLAISPNQNPETNP